MNDLKRVARAIAEELGDDFDHAFASKSEWNAARGEKGGRYRNINEPFQSDYLEAAQAAIDALGIKEMREALGRCRRAFASVGCTEVVADIDAALNRGDVG